MIPYDITKVYLYKVFKEPMYNLAQLTSEQQPKSQDLTYLSLKDYIKYLKDKLKNNKTRDIRICFIYKKQKKEKIITIKLDQ